MRTLYIIDGYAQFFRAYHAIRTPMTSPVTKEPTNMTFGFVGMLLKLLRGEGANLSKDGGRPDYLVVTLDVSGDRGTFRSQLYPDYKAHRPEPPSDLEPQVERCLAMLREIGVPILGAEGFEADDVIASLVERLAAEHPDLRLRIVSKDKDLKQLLRSAAAPVEMYDAHTDALITEETLKVEAGISPSQVVDMLSLMGDAVDNVPGVEGVGEKTAAALIAEYGTLDAIIARAAEIKGKRGERIRAAIPELPLSRQLVTLRRDVPVELKLDEADAARLKLDRMPAILRELGFNRYQEEVKALMAARGGGAVAPVDPRVDEFMATAVARRDVARPAAGGGGGAGETPSLFGDVESREAARAVPTGPENYACIRTREELGALVARLRGAPFVSFDTETTGLSPLSCKLCGISLSIQAGEGFYVPVRSQEPATHLDERTVLGALRPVFEDAAKPKGGHNIKYDMLVLRAAGVEVRGVAGGSDGATPPPLRSEGKTGAERAAGEDICFDSMVASYLIDSSRSSHSLDALALALLGRTNIPLSDLIGSGKGQRTFDGVPLDLATRYAAEDADVALRLREIMLPQLRAMELMELFERVEMPLVEVLAELEWNGTLVDPAELDRQRERLESRIAELKRKIDGASMEAIGRRFNPDSPKQLAAALFNTKEAEEPGLGLKALKRTKTGYSTDIEVLEKLSEDPEVLTPIPALIVEHRQLTKLVGTYLVALKDAINPSTHRIHTSFHQTVAATGRLASSDPNLQNIPIRTDIGREIRRAFIAPPGHVLITADYSQIELRLLAHLSRDPGLTEAFLKDEDIHTAVAAEVFKVPLGEVTREQRNAAKMVNFGIVYGVTSWGLARRLGIGEREAAEIIAGYKRRFAGITTFLEECISQARRYGYVETMLRRRRPIPDIEERNPQRRAFAERTAINSVVQGSAADLIKIAMVDLHGRIRGSDGATPPQRRNDEGGNALRGVKMILQIHDELVFEAPVAGAAAAQKVIVERMERAMEISVPLKVDAHAAGNWYDGK